MKSYEPIAHVAGNKTKEITRDQFYYLFNKIKIEGIGYLSGLAELSEVGVDIVKVVSEGSV
jgi:hypothetical protein